MNKPWIGDMVHYVSYGSAGGEYGSVCRAAVVTQVPDRVPIGEDQVTTAVSEHPLRVGLCVLNPTGQFFNTDVEQNEDEHIGGTWHHQACQDE
jgi:hypothetical protein